MGFLSGSQTYTRFRICGSLPDDWRGPADEAVRKLAHRESLTSRSDEPNAGWVSMFDPGAAPADWLIGQWVVLSVRIDAKRVNGRLFKVLLERRLAEVRAEKGVERLGKNHKQEIKEALKEELLARTLPSLRTVDLVWDTASGEVQVFTSSAKDLDIATSLFRETFALELRPDRMVDWLAERWTWDRIEQTCAAITGNRQAGLPLEPAEDYHSDCLEGSERQIGCDFIAWLWMVSDENGGEMHAGDWDVWLERRLRLTTDEAAVSIDASAPHDGATAREAYAAGHQPSEAVIGLRQGECEYLAGIRVTGRGIALRGVRLPCVVKDGEEEMVYERTGLLERLNGAVRELFRAFVEDRAGEWDRRVGEWMAGEKEEAA